jgi:hypothetical protein
MKFWSRWVFVAAVIFLASSCKKDSFSDDPDLRLQTSVDSLHFDTVFTSTGSITQFIKIFNDNDKGIHVQSVRLMGGATSPFKINVDGTPGPQVMNVSIAANDSAYIIVTVSINPTIPNLPFIVQDSIEIVYNGNKRFIQLDAYGQNAHFYRNKKITGTENWNNDLPYVILGRLTVDTTATLTINEGCRIYVHADAPIIINGTLQVNGKAWDSTRVVFAGDRLDEPYRNFPASFPGIIFTDVSKNNVINYGIVRNAYQGIVADQPSSNGAPKLILNETIIDNAYDAGILGLNTSITARNLLVSNCGKNLLLVNGGIYDFTHATITSYSNSYLQHKDPVLFVTNYINKTTPPKSLDAIFRNCIFWGEENSFVDNEVIVDKTGTTPFSVRFDNVLWRVKTDPANAMITGNKINNQDPQFDSVNASKASYNFRLQDNSPARNKGGASGVNIDLDGAPRPVGLPDLGAYEKQ